MFVAIKHSDRTDRTFKAHYFVCAMDGIGLRSFVRENIQAFGNHKYFRRLKDLRAKSVFVCTMWFDGKGYWEKALADSQRRPVPVVSRRALTTSAS